MINYFDWHITDITVADFDIVKYTKVMGPIGGTFEGYVPVPNANEEVEIKGLKQGKTKVTYTYRDNYFNDYTVSKEITVVQ